MLKEKERDLSLPKEKTRNWPAIMVLVLLILLGWMVYTPTAKGDSICETVCHTNANGKLVCRTTCQDLDYE